MVDAVVVASVDFKNHGVMAEIAVADQFLKP